MKKISTSSTTIRPASSRTLHRLRSRPPHRRFKGSPRRTRRYPIHHEGNRQERSRRQRGRSEVHASTLQDSRAQHR